MKLLTRLTDIGDTNAGFIVLDLSAPIANALLDIQARHRLVDDAWWSVDRDLVKLTSDPPLCYYANTVEFDHYASHIEISGPIPWETPVQTKPDALRGFQIRAYNHGVLWHCHLEEGQRFHPIAPTLAVLRSWPVPWPTIERLAGVHGSSS